MLPRKIDPASLAIQPDYAERTEALITRCKDGKVFVVYFDAKHRDYLPTKQEVAAWGCPVLKELEDGIVYGLPTASPDPTAPPP